MEPPNQSCLEKRVPALLGRLRKEAMDIASSLLINNICGLFGPESVLAQFDRFYDIDKSSQSDSDLFTFFDYT